MTDRNALEDAGSGDKPFLLIARAHDHMLIKGFFPDPIILLLLNEEPAHGYALFKKMCELGVFEEGADATIIYPSLKNLNEAGYVAYELQDEGSGPARKVYRVTAEGKEALETLSRHMSEVSKAIIYYQSRYEASKKAGKKRAAGKGLPHHAGSRKGGAR